MSSQTVLVTNGLSDTGVFAASHLSAAGYDVVTTDFGSLPFKIRSRFAREHFPLPTGNAREFETAFLDLIARLRPAALLPINSRFVHTAIVNRNQIEKTTALNVPDLDAFQAAFNKRKCLEECRDLGIPHPKLYTLAEAKQLFAQAKDPITLVVKPDFDIGAANGVSYIGDPTRLMQAFHQCSSNFGGAMIQEYIPGGVTAMKAVTLLFSSDSRLTAAFTMQKLRQLPLDGGVTALALSTHDEALVKQVIPFFEKWHWRGSAEIEFKLDSRDGCYKLIEINPRFPGYLRFTGMCGLRLPAMAVDHALSGHSAPAIAFPGFDAGVSYCNIGLLIESLLQQFRKPNPMLPELKAIISDLRQASRAVTANRFDPLPMIGRVLSNYKVSKRFGNTFYPRGPAWK